MIILKLQKRHFLAKIQQTIVLQLKKHLMVYLNSVDPFLFFLFYFHFGSNFYHNNSENHNGLGNVSLAAKYYSICYPLLLFLHFCAAYSIHSKRKRKIKFTSRTLRYSCILKEIERFLDVGKLCKNIILQIPPYSRVFFYL